jgi:predicted nucleic acid-binding protein
VELVADANVLLSAAIGGRARLVLNHRSITRLVTPAAAYDEVFEYIPKLAKRKRLQLDTLMLSVAALPVEVIEQTEYERKLSEARRRIAHRDPDDVHVLALALHLNLPVWSNDNDFEVARIDWYTTGELLRTLGLTDR